MNNCKLEAGYKR